MSSDDDSDLENVPFSFDQQINILCSMNAEQMNTIDELQKKLELQEADNKFLITTVKDLERKIESLQKELVLAVQNQPATCYISCSHCKDEETGAEAIASVTASIATMMSTPLKNEVVVDLYDEKEEPKPQVASNPFGFGF